MALNNVNSSKKDIQSISNKSKSKSSKDHINIHNSDDKCLKENAPNIHLSSKSDKRKNNEEENSQYKKSSSYHIREGASPITINNFEDNNNNDNIDVTKSPVKKSKTCNENNINRLDLGYKLDKGANHLGTVLETINEDSKVDSSELSDDEDEVQNNNDNNNNNNRNINSNIITNNENNRKKETNSETKKNDSDYNTATATKNHYI